MGSSRAPWVPPESFDEYRLVKALGQGSMGQVWLAHDTVLDRLVAVKFIAELPAHDALRRRFLTEARAAARVQHPNIIAVYRVGEIGARPYLISEYVRGDSLDKIARPVGGPRLLAIAIGLARGLAAAHRQGVLHRDLKPANAILSESGEVKLLDFGLAKLLPQVPPYTVPGEPIAAGEDPVAAGVVSSADAPAGTHNDGSTLSEVVSSAGTEPRTSEASDPLSTIAGFPSVTRAGAVMGTPAYMSPEAWRGEPATPRSDIYSLGALLYELGTGAPPRRDHSPGAAGAARVADPPPLRTAAPGIDPRLAAIADRCLRLDPNERFGSGDAVLEALEALAERPAGDSTARLQVPRPAPARPSARPRLRILAGSALVLALALVAYTGITGERPPMSHRPEAPARAAKAPVRSATPGRCPDAMVPVPSGTFLMGSPEGRGKSDEHPQRQVTLSAYCIDRTEVTVTAYAACVAAGGCPPALLSPNWTNFSTSDVKRLSRWCNRMDRPDHPINCVDWEQAAAYCAWQGKRLPSEAEWEYAARGSEARTYPWGQAAPGANWLNACGGECTEMMKRDLSWLESMYADRDGWETTAPVGSFPQGASPFGALDMAGNVAEWTADWYDNYPAQADIDPKGPATGTSRVSRGGSWSSTRPSKVRSAGRDWPDPIQRAIDLGFRCARDP
ncbi:MAG TPA: bifunctional serine/threonine-protein kinase/formylglycine-generating enzyme family protein [Kofleriaceae bacterium]|jgi:formylglycine-generating enzyme required for sulfatase activity|nr:bifunctional serine/threonine-protein kinase/formylglycine-generating enzyme family protein [Kofleriaceae bacterium]